MKLSTLGFKDFQLQVLSRTTGTLNLFAKNKTKQKNLLLFFIVFILFYSTWLFTSAEFMQARTAHQFVCLLMTIITQFDRLK